MQVLFKPVRTLLNMCHFVCGTMSHAKLSLHWSDIYYPMTLEWHSGRGSEMVVDTKHVTVHAIYGVCLNSFSTRAKLLRQEQYVQTK